SSCQGLLGRVQLKKQDVRATPASFDWISRANQGSRHVESLFGFQKICAYNPPVTPKSAWPDSDESFKCSAKGIRALEANGGGNAFDTAPGNQQPSPRFGHTNGSDKLRRRCSKLCLKQAREVAG